MLMTSARFVPQTIRNQRPKRDLTAILQSPGIISRFSKVSCKTTKQTAMHRPQTSLIERAPCMTLFMLDYASRVGRAALTGALRGQSSTARYCRFFAFASLTAVGRRHTLLRRLARPKSIFGSMNRLPRHWLAVRRCLSSFQRICFENRYKEFWFGSMPLPLAITVAGVGVAPGRSFIPRLCSGDGHHHPAVWAGLCAMWSQMGSAVLKRGELYVTCAFAGPYDYHRQSFGLTPSLVAITCAAVTFTLRTGSMALVEPARLQIHPPKGSERNLNWHQCAHF
jgi:hypothetical protein